MNDREEKLKASCVEEIERVIAYFQRTKQRIIPWPNIIFNLKGVCAGRCQIREKCINLNLALLLQEGSKFLNRTPGHEAVHWVEFYLYGSSSHGKRWKGLMDEMGLDNSRCHNYDCSKVRRKTKKYDYKCGCMTFSISAIRHRKILKGKIYRCLKCNQKIILVE